LASSILQEIGDPEIDPAMNQRYLAQMALGGYAANLMQPVFAKRFKGMNEAALDRVLASFAFENCRPQAEVLAVLKQYWNRPA
jgi:endoglucanase